MKDDDAHGGNDSDDERLDLWSFLRAVNTCSPVAEDALFGDYAAARATLRTNRIFREQPVLWDAPSNNIRS